MRDGDEELLSRMRAQLRDGAELAQMGHHRVAALHVAAVDEQRASRRPARDLEEIDP